MNIAFIALKLPLKVAAPVHVRDANVARPVVVRVPKLDAAVQVIEPKVAAPVHVSDPTVARPVVVRVPKLDAAEQVIEP